MPASESKNERSKVMTIEVCPELNELDIVEAITWLEGDRETTSPETNRQTVDLAIGAKHAAAAKGGA